MNEVYLGLGSNLGNRLENIRKAVDRINRDMCFLRQSSIYETKPAEGYAQPDYLNAAVSMKTIFNPFELLNWCKAVETEIGRTRNRIRWSARVIDIDILLFGSMMIKTGFLQVPHPGLPKRQFVLAPLAEIAGAMVHPVLGKSIGRLAYECPSQGVRLFNSNQEMLIENEVK